MAASALDNELSYYFNQLDEPQKKSLLNMIKTFVKPEEETESVNIEQYNQELAEAQEQYEKGDYITHEEMIRQIKQWQKNITLYRLNLPNNKLEKLMII